MAARAIITTRSGGEPAESIECYHLHHDTHPACLSQYSGSIAIRPFIFPIPQVIWAKELDNEANRKLLDYFKERRIWLLEGDAEKRILIPYSEPAT